MDVTNATVVILSDNFLKSPNRTKLTTPSFKRKSKKSFQGSCKVQVAQVLRSRKKCGKPHNRLLAVLATVDKTHSNFFNGHAIIRT